MNQLISTLNEYLGRKAPQLPVPVKEFLVKVAPYICLLGIIVSVPAILAWFGVSAGFGGYGGADIGVRWRYFGLVAGTGALASVVLNLLALPGLFKPAAAGWTMIFYSLLVHLVMDCLLYIIVAGLVGAAIGAYLLFQIRPYYFGEVALSPEAPPQTPPKGPPPLGS
jgi:hypothetical protein